VRLRPGPLGKRLAAVRHTYDNDAHQYPAGQGTGKDSGQVMGKEMGKEMGKGTLVGQGMSLTHYTA
jgi:hypothetical protein